METVIAALYIFSALSSVTMALIIRHDTKRIKRLKAELEKVAYSPEYGRITHSPVFVDVAEIAAVLAKVAEYKTESRA